MTLENLDPEFVRLELHKTFVEIGGIMYEALKPTIALIRAFSAYRHGLRQGFWTFQRQVDYERWLLDQPPTLIAACQNRRVAHNIQRRWMRGYKHEQR